MRYRYYVSLRLISGAANADRATPSDGDSRDATSPGGQRIPAARLETVVRDRLRELLGNSAALQDVARDHPAPEQRALVASAARLAARWPELPLPIRRRILKERHCTDRCSCRRDQIGIDGDGLLHRLSAGSLCDGTEAIAASPRLNVTVPVALKRVGMEMRLVMPGEVAGPDPDWSLARLIARAHHIRKRLTGDTPLSINEVGRTEPLTRSYATRLLRLGYLAPDITARLLSGEHPPELNATQLMQDTRLPLD